MIKMRYVENAVRPIFSTRLTPEIRQAVKVAAAKAGKLVYEVIEDALRRHPLVKREMEITNGR